MAKKSTGELLKQLSDVEYDIETGFGRFSLDSMRNIIAVLTEILRHIEEIRCTEHTECLNVAEMGMHCAADKSRKGS